MPATAPRASTVLAEELLDSGPGDLGGKAAPVDVEAVIGGRQQARLMGHGGDGQGVVEQRRLLDRDDAVPPAVEGERGGRRRAGAVER